MALDARIQVFANLVGLVLVLLTLFTSQRTTALRSLRDSAQTTTRDAQGEVALDIALCLATAAVFAAGVPLWWETLQHLRLGSDSGPVRSAFALVWVLLVALIVWQIVLVKSAHDLSRKLV